MEMFLIRLVNVLILGLIIKAANGLLQSILRVGTASQIGVFDLWNDNGVYCDKGDVLFRHDYIDRIDDTCLREIHIHFKTNTGDFILKYGGPFGRGALDTMLLNNPNSIYDTNSSSGNSTNTLYTPIVNTDDFEFLLVNKEETKAFAAISYLPDNSSSPTFGFNYNGYVYRQKRKMWVSNVTGFSSEFTKGLGWTAAEIIGVNDVYPKYGDKIGAWTPECCDSYDHYITVGFAEEIYIEEIHIYETYNAGGVKKISIMSPSFDWVTVWETAKVLVIKDATILSTYISNSSFLSKEVKIEIDLSEANNWVEIDAVQIVGLPAADTIPPALASERPVTSLEIMARTEANPTCDSLVLARNTTYCPGPKVSIQTTSIDVEIGDVVNISCDIVSDKKIVDTRWTFNDIDVTPDNDKYLGVLLGSHVLTITNVSLSDAGYYECFASNLMGEGKSDVIYVNIATDITPIQGGTVDNSDISTETSTIQFQGSKSDVIANIFTDTSNIQGSTSDVTVTGTSKTPIGQGTSTHCKAGMLTLCSCAYKQRLDHWASQTSPNYTTEEWRVILEPQLHEIRRNLTVNKKSLSSYRRTLNCAEDKRGSSETIGWIGVFVLTFFCVVIFVFDATSVFIKTVKI